MSDGVSLKCKMSEMRKVKQGWALGMRFTHQNEVRVWVGIESDFVCL